MRKKLFIFLLSVISVVCLVVGLSACENSNSNDDNGNTNQNQTNEENSVSNDSATLHTHSLIHFDASSATCTAEGNIEYWICSDCGKYFLDENGLTEATQLDTVTTKESHTKSEIVIENEVAATCVDDGSYDSVVYCSVCGGEISRETIIIPKTEHAYDAGVVTTEPTCDTTGVKTYTCTACEDIYTETLAANGHIYNSDKVCTVCGAEKISEGLVYTLSTDKTYYTVSGIGTCTDTDLIIPATYNDLPVTEIGYNAFNSCTQINRNSFFDLW